jgi:hypothetical protein
MIRNKNQRRFNNRGSNSIDSAIEEGFIHEIEIGKVER